MSFHSIPGGISSRNGLRYVLVLCCEELTQLIQKER